MPCRMLFKDSASPNFAPGCLPAHGSLFAGKHHRGTINHTLPAKELGVDLPKIHWIFHSASVRVCAGRRGLAPACSRRLAKPLAQAALRETMFVMPYPEKTRLGISPCFLPVMFATFSSQPCVLGFWASGPIPGTFEEREQPRRDRRWLSAYREELLLSDWQ
jgi:hypothetical protein